MYWRIYMKRNYSIFLAVLLILYSVSLFERGNTKFEEETLVTTFNNSQFQPIQINLNTWGTLNNSFSTLEEMRELSKHFTDDLKISNFDHVEEKESESLREFTVIRASKNAKTTVKLQSIKDELSDTANTYLVIDIIIYDKYKGLAYLKEKLDKIYAANDIKANTNITIMGHMKGKLTEKERDKICKSIMKNIDARVEEVYETEKIYSVYGYTKLIDEYITSNQKKINVNCAFRYNEYENKTYLYLATPLITVEY